MPVDILEISYIVAGTEVPAECKDELELIYVTPPAQSGEPEGE